MNDRYHELEEKRNQFLATPEEERISEFVQNNPPGTERTVEEWMEEHQKLTGACTIGGLRFIRANGFKRYEKYTVEQFLDVVDGAYGGKIISNVKKHYEGGK